jgi:hypothetical protein
MPFHSISIVQTGRESFEKVINFLEINAMSPRTLQDKHLETMTYNPVLQCFVCLDKLKVDSRIRRMLTGRLIGVRI